MDSILLTVNIHGWIQENWALIGAIITIGVVLFACQFFVRHYAGIVLNIFSDTPPPLLVNLLDFRRVEGDIVRFRSFDGISLQGMWLNPPKGMKVKGTILFCHEYGADMYTASRYTTSLIESGYRVFTFDFRAHGKSSGASYHPLQWPSDKELCDVLGALAHVRQTQEAEGSSAELGIFGISRGAGVALLAASTDPDIKAVLCDGAFCTQTTIITYMKRWAHHFAKIRLVYENHPEIFWKFLYRVMIRKAQVKLNRRFPSVSKAAKSLSQRPVFFIHGEKDSYIRVEQSKELHEITPDPKYLWIVPKARHNQSVMVDPAQYSARTVGFFDKHLANETISDEIIRTGLAVENIA